MAILSIQSHVVYGAVGNSAAVFPLQRLGHEVWPVNTVEFSNHTGYGEWRGQALPAKLVDDLVRGVEERGALSRCGALLSGYLGSADIGLAVAGVARRVKTVNPKALYCCDPVMGDVGRGLYVHSDIPGIFSGSLLPLADIVTPNQFELELLSGTEVVSAESVKKAIGILHEKGLPVILVTSYRDGPPGTLAMVASDGDRLWRVDTPELYFADTVSGTGDLCSAIFLSGYLETSSIRAALEKTAASIYGILEATYRTGGRELRIIDAQEELIRPRNRFTPVEFGRYS
ncbi:MAG: pyridoxal kinase PdxY [Spirochaetaceae bacterium]|jgi:pyridoxine kinase|nr:pyridoxal kinase PdxY [Spirochaetaceae bacterium]